MHPRDVDILPLARHARAGHRSAAGRREAGTGIIMMNLGGPATLDEVEPFLRRLFADRELLRLPWQDVLGKFIAKRRTPKVRALYEAIGGGSPILRWTEAQGVGMCARLDQLSPATAPHRFYVAFRYAQPFADDAVRAMHADGVTRAIAFTQYPQWSCTTTGSSLNDLWRALKRQDLEDAFEWSIVDRWGEHDGFVRSVAGAIEDGLQQYAAEERDDVLLLYSAHSLPLSVIDRGDAYPAEVAATVSRVTQELDLPNPHLLCYQSEVGPVRWLGASTESVIRQLAAQGRKNVLVVPIAFTSDHIETLSEVDLEYAHLARSLGMTGFRRAPSLNARPQFLDALADIVVSHVDAGRPWSAQYRTRCPGCTNDACRGVPKKVARGTTSPLADQVAHASDALMPVESLAGR